MRLLGIYIARVRLAVARWHRRQALAHVAAASRYLEGLRNET